MDCGLLILGLSWSAVSFKLQVVSYRMLSYVRLAKDCMMHDVSLQLAADSCQKQDARCKMQDESGGQELCYEVFLGPKKTIRLSVKLTPESLIKVSYSLLAH